MALFSNESDKNSNSDAIAKSTNSLAAKTATPAPGAPAPAVERTAAAARLDRGTKISGQLRFDGPAQIDGQVDGEIDAKEITIGESARLSAQMRADSVIVCGEYKGEITASQRIEIRATAKVTGNITAPKLIVQEGAVFEGKCSMSSEPARREQAPAPHRNGAATPSQAQA